jgi:hypothetical protein
MNWRTNVVLTVGFLGVRTPLGQDALWVGRILHSNTALDPSLGSLPGAAAGTTFVLVCRRSPRRLVSASTPKRQQSKIIAWCLRYHPHYITHCSKMGNSCTLRPRARLATPRVRGQDRPLDLKEPVNGYKGRTSRRALAPHRQAVRELRLPRRLALRPEENAQPLLAWGQRAMPWPTSPPVARDDGRGSFHLSLSLVAASVVITRGGAPLEAS